MTTTQVAPTAHDTCRDGDLTHYYCCDPDKGWCGVDLREAPHCTESCGCVPCVVCDDLAYEACECSP